MKREKEIQVVFGILFIFGTVLIAATNIRLTSWMKKDTKFSIKDGVQ